MTARIVGIAGSLSRPSKTQALFKRMTTWVARVSTARQRRIQMERAALAERDDDEDYSEW